MDLDAFIIHASAGIDPNQFTSPNDRQHLVSEPSAARTRPEEVEDAGPVPRLLLELPGRGLQDRLRSLVTDQTRREFDHLTPQRPPVLLDEDHLHGLGAGDHTDDSRPGTSAHELPTRSGEEIKVHAAMQQLRFSVAWSGGHAVALPLFEWAMCRL